MSIPQVPETTTPSGQNVPPPLDEYLLVKCKAALLMTDYIPAVEAMPLVYGSLELLIVQYEILAAHYAIAIVEQVEQVERSIRPMQGEYRDGFMAGARAAVERADDVAAGQIRVALDAEGVHL